MSIFDQGIKTEDKGMAGGETYYDIEELYQAFKERLTNELMVRSDELLNDANVIDTGDWQPHIWPELKQEG